MGHYCFWNNDDLVEKTWEFRKQSCSKQNECTAHDVVKMGTVSSEREEQSTAEDKQYRVFPEDRLLMLAEQQMAHTEKSTEGGKQNLYLPL